MSEGYYKQAQICINGHVATANYTSSDAATRFCDACGAKTITNCPKCHVAIRGEHVTPGVVFIGFPYHPPKFCYGCGEPFPWISAAIDAARDLALEADMSEEEANLLASSMIDIATENPKTELAATRIKKIVGKIGGAIGSAIKDIAVGIGTEVAVRTIEGRF